MAIFPVNFHSRHVTTVVTRTHTVDFVDCTCDKIDRAGDEVDGTVDFVANVYKAYSAILWCCRYFDAVSLKRRTTLTVPSSGPTRPLTPVPSRKSKRPVVVSRSSPDVKEEKRTGGRKSISEGGKCCDVNAKFI